MTLQSQGKIRTVCCVELINGLNNQVLYIAVVYVGMNEDSNNIDYSINMHALTIQITNFEETNWTFAYVVIPLSFLTPTGDQNLISLYDNKQTSVEN